jgi:hypothetical protein
VVRVLGPICVVLAGLSGVTACYSPVQPDCGFICGPGGACPDNYSCNGNGQCQRNGTAPSACDVVDSGVRRDEGEGFDVPPADADVTAPYVTMVVPDGSAPVTDLVSNIYVYFSEGVQNVNLQTFQVTIGGSPVAGTISPSTLESQSGWMFYPSSSYPSGAEVDIELTGSIVDFAGNGLLGAPIVRHFFTGP